MIVCPYNPYVLLDDIYETFYCVVCPNCRLLTSLCSGTEFVFTEEENDL